MSCHKEEIDPPPQEDAGNHGVAGELSHGGMTATGVSVVTEQPLYFVPCRCLHFQLTHICALSWSHVCVSTALQLILSEKLIWTSLQDFSAFVNSLQKLWTRIYCSSPMSPFPILCLKPVFVVSPTQKEKPFMVCEQLDLSLYLKL